MLQTHSVCVGFMLKNGSAGRISGTNTHTHIQFARARSAIKIGMPAKSIWNVKECLARTSEVSALLLEPVLRLLPIVCRRATSGVPSMVECELGRCEYVFFVWGGRSLVVGHTAATSNCNSQQLLTSPQWEVDFDGRTTRLAHQVITSRGKYIQLKYDLKPVMPALSVVKKMIQVGSTTIIYLI